MKGKLSEWLVILKLFSPTIIVNKFRHKKERRLHMQISFSFPAGTKLKSEILKPNIFTKAENRFSLFTMYVN
jgi:hypothetical protein